MWHARVYKWTMYILTFLSVIYLFFYHNFIPNEKYTDIAIYLVVIFTIVIHLYATMFGNFPSSLFSKYATTTININLLHLLGISLLLFYMFFSVYYIIPSLVTSVFGDKVIKSFLVQKTDNSSRYKCKRRLVLKGYELSYFHHCINKAMFGGLPESSVNVVFDAKESWFGSVIDGVALHPAFRNDADK